jgi:hypothetical protein
MHNHHDIVKKLLDSKAVDFNAIGKMVSELGPSVSLQDDPWENFCLTMKFFVRFYRFPFPFPRGPFDNREQLGDAG